MHYALGQVILTMLYYWTIDLTREVVHFFRSTNIPEAARRKRLPFQRTTAFFHSLPFAPSPTPHMPFASTLKKPEKVSVMTG